MEKVKAWWFAASDRLPHGDGRKVVVGKTHSLKGGDVILCQRALHGSEHPFDALKYAPGPYLYRTEHWGSLQWDSDKIGSRHRTYLAMQDVTPQLRQVAREQALSVIHLWDAPDMVRRYLETGDETLQEVAQEAAWATAQQATQRAAWEAAASPTMLTMRQRFAQLIEETFTGVNNDA